MFFLKIMGCVQDGGALGGKVPLVRIGKIVGGVAQGHDVDWNVTQTGGREKTTTNPSNININTQAHTQRSKYTCQKTSRHIN